MKPARFVKTRKISLIALPACALLALVAWSPTSPDTRVVVGTGNTLNSSTKAMIAGDNNTTNNPSSKVLIVGQENTHCGSNNLLVGIGPNFSEATHRTINSFTNFGAGATDLPVKHRGDGTETDVMPCINGQIPWPVGEELDRLLEIERLIDLEGWAYLIVDEANVKGDVTNYPLPHIQGRWKYETAHALSGGIPC